MIVYDSEEDTTLPPVKQLSPDFTPSVRLLRNAYGHGALNAIKTGLEGSQTDLIIVTMADLSDPPEVINDLVQAAESSGAAIVCASRYMKGGRQIGGPKFKGFLSNRNLNPLTADCRPHIRPVPHEHDQRRCYGSSPPASRR